MIKEFRSKSNEELGKIIVKMKSKLLEFRFQEASGELEGTHKIKMVKKTIASALTILSERNVKLSLSSHDHALITVKDGKISTNSFKPKGSTSIIFEEEKDTKILSKEKTPKKNNLKKEKSKIISSNDKKVVEKNTAKTLKKKKSDPKVPSSVIRKSTGRGQ